tara:strand:+ start:6273 stop:6455 length:183 start_codon:yes stop_codon:yes gene_type:complete
MMALGIIYLIGLLAFIKAESVAEMEIKFTTIEYLYTAIFYPYIFGSVIFLILLEMGNEEE